LIIVSIMATDSGNNRTFSFLIRSIGALSLGLSTVSIMFIPKFVRIYGSHIDWSDYSTTHSEKIHPMPTVRISSGGPPNNHIPIHINTLPPHHPNHNNYSPNHHSNINKTDSPNHQTGGNSQLDTPTGRSSELGDRVAPIQPPLLEASIVALSSSSPVVASLPAPIITPSHRFLNPQHPQSPRRFSYHVAST